MIQDNEAAAWDILGAIFKRLELRERAIARQSRHRPMDADGWAMAASRAAFVQEDCRNWADASPDQVLGEYEFALASGDDIYAYLLERCGLPALQTAGAWAELERFQRAVYDANPPEPSAAAELEGYYQLLNPLRAELSKIRPPEGVILVQPASHAQPSPAATGAQSNGHRRPDPKPLPRLADEPDTGAQPQIHTNGHAAAEPAELEADPIEILRRL
jgi:hypothetical protein